MIKLRPNVIIIVINHDFILKPNYLFTLVDLSTSLTTGTEICVVPDLNHQDPEHVVRKLIRMDQTEDFYHQIRGI